MCNNSNETEDDEPLRKPINKNILNYYKPYVNDISKLICTSLKFALLRFKDKKVSTATFGVFSFLYLH